MADFLNELFVLARDRVEVRALLREFLDSERIIACAQIDERATLSAGHLIVDCQPSDDFRRALSAILTKNGETDCCRMTHDANLST
jgi:hypothetical protein